VKRQKNIIELLREYREVKESGYKIYLSYDAIKKLCGIPQKACISEKIDWLIKSGEIEVVEVILPNEKGLPIKRIKAARLC